MFTFCAQCYNICVIDVCGCKLSITNCHFNFQLMSDVEKLHNEAKGRNLARPDPLTGENVQPPPTPKQALLGDLYTCLGIVLAQLNRRFPKFGANTDQYAIGHLLHPAHKGVILTLIDDEPNFRQELVDSMVRDHPSSRPADADAASAPLDEAMIVDDSFEVEPESAFAKALKNAATTQAAAAPEEPPLKTELDFYLKMKPAAPNVNVLSWWDANKEQFKLLSRFAR